MRARLLVAPAAALVLLLAACGTEADTASPSPTPSEEPAQLVLPPDAVLGLVGIATAPNGATADVSIVVHASLPYLVPEAAEAMSTTLAWCAGELDDGVIAGRGYTFTAVDVTVTPRDGDWPDDVALLVEPTPNPEVGSTVAAGAGLRQVDASDDDTLGDSVPHCLQPAVIDGAGSGTLYLGIPQDIAGVNDLASFTAWTIHDFGLSAALPGDLGDSGVTFSSCASALTPLGEQNGAPTDDWAETFTADGCRVGGAG